MNHICLYHNVIFVYMYKQIITTSLCLLNVVLIVRDPSITCATPRMASTIIVFIMYFYLCNLILLLNVIITAFISVTLWCYRKLKHFIPVKLINERILFLSVQISTKKHL